MCEETGHNPRDGHPRSAGGAVSDSLDFGDSFLKEVALEPPPFRKPAPGERLGGSDGRRFEVISELGGGAMGLVFRARDEELQREVALKFILPRAGRDGQWLISMLRQEARAIAQLDHENIVRIFDVAEWVGASWEPRIPFLVMECLEGESLDALLQREHRLGVRRAVEIMCAVAAGLAHAHGRHIVHRDLKPSNVFLTRRGTVKLLDFGLAWLTSPSSSPLPSLPSAGTPPYMSPEQWRGGAQDERTDLWSAGVVLYEMLTGELPYPSATLEELRDQVVSREPAPRVRARHPDVPEELDALVALALAKEPCARPRSAAALRDSLRRLEERWGPWREEPLSLVPQRRQVTLLSCRLVGSGGLAGELDPEDFSELEASFQKSCSEVIQRHGGSITTCVGDEVLACFGYPLAREEDSERAVLAGMRLAASLPVRVGIHTETVVFDDSLPELRGRTPTIQGEAPRIASWLARQAGSGTVVLSHATHTLVQPAFESEALGARTFEGVSGARTVEAWRVTRVRKAVFRFDRALATGPLSPLVGREDELRRLLGAWERAREGRGSVVLVSGEAGIGKSRLIQELRLRVPTATRIRLRCQCWSQFANSAFHPLIEMLQHLFRLEAEGSPGDNLARLEAHLGTFGLEPEHMALIAAFLSLPVKENLPILQLSPERQKERTFEALAELLLRMSRLRPVLAVVEDLHWADPSTLELLDFLLGRVETARVLVLLSARPGFQHAWPSTGPLLRVELERLPAWLTATLVQEAAGERELPRETVLQLVEKTDGIPLFVEEMTRMVAGGGVLPSIPVTLHELLLARLDMLPPGQKALAQLCSVVGRGFSHALMATLTRRESSSLRADLEELVASGLLQREAEEDGPGYQFRHALLQDAAYQSLLRCTRRQHHRRIAQALLEQFPEVVEAQPEVLAHHYTEAGDTELAIHHWMRAGIRASLHSANQEAVSHLRYALKLLRSLPDAAQRIHQELQLLIALGIPLSQVQGYRSAEVKRTYARARELFQSVGEALPELELPYWGPFAYYFARAEYRLSHELAEQLVELGSRRHDPELLSLGYRMMAADFFAWGQQHAAREHVERALACSDFSLERHRILAEKHWVDPTAVALIHAALIHAVLGQPERALQYRREALELAGRIGHANTRAYTLLYAALSLQVRGDARGTLALAEECHALASERWLRLFIEWSGLLRGWALARLGRPAEGLAQMREFLGRWRMTGLRAGMPHNLGLLAEVHLGLGEPREAWVAVQEGLRWVEAVGERSYEAELHRIGAVAHQALGQEQEAHASLLVAVRIAREQGAGEFERHALLALERPAGPGPGAEVPGRV
ncbi:putative ATPase [Archangium gephyra]|uniref:ATPase n=1 Tax=Archangium gephyra TaxID=48 RepID=A0AAC8TJK5_9BACT|nr:protein kinase [Archangium gephyra]AKJ08458.1 Adenylate cyclase [Archangium gephyra]REG20542.1 putative ATPase [Archangium gephyra]